jgi:hypothetical protein
MTRKAIDVTDAEPAILRLPWDEGSMATRTLGRQALKRFPVGAIRCR